jgi:ribonuclease HI
MHVDKNTSILQWNCCSLNCRIGELRTLLTQIPIPIVCINEAKCKSNAPTISNYVAYIDDNLATTNRSVVTYVRRDLQQIQVPLQGNNSGIEVNAVTISKGNIKLTVVNTYIRPGIMVDMSAFKRILESLEGDYVVVGDFNAHHQLWGSPSADTRGREICDIIDDLALCSLNDGSPTYHRTSSGYSHLDLCIVTPSLVSSSWTVHSDQWGSDHFPTLITVPGLNGIKSKTAKVTDWRKYRTLVESKLREGVQLQEAMAQAKREATMSTKVPYKAPPIDHRYTRLQAQRNRSQRKVRRTGDLVEIERERKFQAAAKRHLIYLKKMQFARFCSSLSRQPSLGKVWNMVRAMSEPTRALQPFLSVALKNGWTTQESLDKFLDHVTNVPKPMNPSRHERYLAKLRHLWEGRQMNVEPHGVFETPFTRWELDCALASCENKTSVGPDGISYQDIRSLDEPAKGELLELLNGHWTRGEFPDQWKLADVVPLPKLGKPKHEIGSYRPIALTSCVGKVYERLVKRRLDWYLEKEYVFADTVTAYRKARGTMDGLANLVCDLEEFTFQKHVTAVVFLDLKQAFDCVPKESILYALHTAGVSGRMLSVLESYLTSRKIQGKIDKTRTQPRCVNKGVPQGGVLSPILFNLVVAEVANLANQKVHISTYADDIVIWSHRRTASINLQNDMQRAVRNVVEHLDRNGLVISPEKTALLLVTNKRDESLNVFIGDKKIEQVDRHKFLGLLMDKKLSWIPEANLLVDRAKKVSNIIRCLAAGKFGATTEALLRVSDAINGSRALYALPFMKAASEATLEMVYAIQHRDCRTALGLLKVTPSDIVLAEAGSIPYSLQATQRALAHVAKLATQHVGHGLIEKLRQRPHSSYGMIYEQLLNLGINDSNETSAFVASTPIWQLEKPRTEPGIVGVASKAEINEGVLQKLFRDQMQNSWEGYSEIFTDGSVVGASSSFAVYMPEQNVQISAKLPFPTSSTVSELAGIREALKGLRAQSVAKYVICTDSKSAIQSIAGAKSEANSRLMFTILDELKGVQESGYEVGFQWVPSHCGIRGNEVADRLAAEAHMTDRQVSDITRSAQDIKCIIRRAIRMQHETWWSDRQGTHRWLVSGQRPSRLRTNYLGRRKQIVLHRLRAGYALTANTLHKYGKVASPKCSSCNVVDTVSHVLLSCSKFDGERDALRVQLLVRGMDLDLGSVLGVENGADLGVLFEFLESTGLIDSL